MSKFKELEEFERRFDLMDVSELRQWKTYWTQHSQQLAPKIRKEAIFSVRVISKNLLEVCG